MTRSPIYRFTSKTLAASFANAATKPMRTILGDDGKYWVVTPADGSRLERSGYTMA